MVKLIIETKTIFILGSKHFMAVRGTAVLALLLCSELRRFLLCKNKLTTVGNRF